MAARGILFLVASGTASASRGRFAFLLYILLALALDRFLALFLRPFLALLTAFIRLRVIFLLLRCRSFSFWLTL